MQSVKLVMRQIGVPNNVPVAEGGVISGKDFEEYVEYQLSSQGYVLQASHYLGAAENGSGYKFMFVFVKDEPQAKEAIRAFDNA